jgi:Domain of unknown function (DUF4386)
MVANSSREKSMNRVARVAGFTFLFAILIVILVNFGISFRLIVEGDAAETARNIMANETLFRINIACNLVYSLAIMLLLASLYVILNPVNHTLALLAAICRLVLALTWCLTALNMLGALGFLSNAAYLSVFEKAQLQALARLHLASGHDAYYVGLPFWGLASLLCSFLWLRSGYVPRLLAAFGILTSGWCVFCAFTFLVFPRFDMTVNAWWYDMPMVIFEIVLGIWLLSKGLSPPASVPHEMVNGYGNAEDA